jgi:signal transduction histidine kinase/CheY-like chemotaxis protein
VKLPFKRLNKILLLFLIISIQSYTYGQENYVSKANQRLAVDLILEKAQLALESAKFQEADKLISSATEIAKDSIIYAQTQLIRVSYFSKTQQLDEALRQIDATAPYFEKASENTAQLLLLKADVLIKSDLLVEADEAITRSQLILATVKNSNLNDELKLRKAQLDLKIKNYDKAKSSFEELLPSLINKGQFYSAAQVGLSLANIAYENKDYASSKAYLTESIQVSEKFGLNFLLKESYKLYAGLLKIEGDFQNSVLYLEKFTELTKSEEELLANLTATLELDKLKKENKALLDSNTEKTKELKGLDTSYILLCVFITLLSLLTLSLFKNNKLRAKSNHVLEDKNSALIDERDRAQDAAKIKADFLSTITHELRTPLYAVTGLTHLLLETRPRNDQKEHLETLQSSGEYLLSLIDNILDFNKLEANKVELEAIPFDLQKRMNDIGSSLKGQATDQNNTLHIQYDSNIPSRLQGDPVKVSQILINLIGNAIKFTKGGDIYIRANRVNTTSDKCLVHFEIEDNGKGISKEKQEAIFENFTQEGSSTTREYGGTGLGLAIVKNLVTLMGGDVLLDSEIGRGSKFSFDIWFDLPDSNKFFTENHFPTTSIEEPEAEITAKIKNLNINTEEKVTQQPTPIVPEVEKQRTEAINEGVISSKPATPAELSSKLILIVEDNKINQMITRKILEAKNFTCDVANNGQEAVEAVRSKKYDLILMDIHMPVKDGKEATKEIRNFDREIPIIALTAVTLSESEKEFYEIGFDDIIPKPFKMDEFFEKIQTAFSNYEIL